MNWLLNQTANGATFLQAIIVIALFVVLIASVAVGVNRSIKEFKEIYCKIEREEKLNDIERASKSDARGRIYWL